MRGIPHLTFLRDNRQIASFAYDAVGCIRSATDPTGLTLRYGYDNLNRVTRITYPPDDRFEQYAYSLCCPRLVDSRTDRAGRTNFYDYNERDQLGGSPARTTPLSSLRAAPTAMSKP